MNEIQELKRKCEALQKESIKNKALVVSIADEFLKCSSNGFWDFYHLHCEDEIDGFERQYPYVTHSVVTVNSPPKM